MYPEQPWKHTTMNLHFQKEMWMKVTERFPATENGNGVVHAPAVNLPTVLE